MSEINSSAVWVSPLQTEMGSGEQAVFSYKEIKLYFYPPESQGINFKSSLHVRAVIYQCSEFYSGMKHFKVTK